MLASSRCRTLSLASERTSSLAALTPMDGLPLSTSFFRPLSDTFSPRQPAAVCRPRLLHHRHAQRVQGGLRVGQCLADVMGPMLMPLTSSSSRRSQCSLTFTATRKAPLDPILQPFRSRNRRDSHLETLQSCKQLGSSKHISCSCKVVSSALLASPSKNDTWEKMCANHLGRVHRESSSSFRDQLLQRVLNFGFPPYYAAKVV
mmetsp:Transcript_26624/g.38038  ORF Transcript_26624/g.38038 Transcript_26624/m.38038 type:complete len:203 (+) Transcript_26624:792-1400(+)